MLRGKLDTFSYTMPINYLFVKRMSSLEMADEILVKLVVLSVTKNTLVTSLVKEQSHSFAEVFKKKIPIG